MSSTSSHCRLVVSTIINYALTELLTRIALNMSPFVLLALA
jgi:hypothetical protein